jgi:outer membrane receptor protein involved in Fe transport
MDRQERPADPRAERSLKQLSFLCRRRALLLAAGAACAAPAGAQTVILPDVEIVGTTPLPGVGVPKEQVPANVQSARGDDIDRSHASDLPTFMNRRLGSVHVNEVQGNPFQPDVSFRGFTASPLLGTPQGLSVYLDGVRMNQPFGDVVSWDLIPRVAVSSITLMPGSNPLFGLNTLGGALSLVTKDGVANPGSSVQVRGGSHGLAEAEFESGGAQANGLDWYAAGDRFHSRGWRDASPTDIGQLFGKLGWRDSDTRLALSASFADNDMTGNGLQEQRLLARDRASIYTSPDTTRNRSLTLNLGGTRRLSDALSFSGNAYYRNIRTATLNGDVNDDSLDQQIYQPNAAEQRALTAAGYSGFPTSGADAANTPFPQWRCIANALLNDEPAEKCSGVKNTTDSQQRNYGFAGQLSWQESLAGYANLFVAGAALDISRVHFREGSELGYINPDHSITGVGAFGDGVTGGNVDGVPYDTRVDLGGETRTWSLFSTNTLALDPRTHFTLSGRYNHTTVRNRDAIVPGGGPGSLDSDNTYARFNPAVGITFSPDAAVNLYAGYNEGSRAPTAIELGCADPDNPCRLPNAFAGDPPLRQVVTRTIELGVRGGSKADLAWNAGVFRADSTDDILFVADNPSGFGYFKNFGKTRRQGVEAGLNARVGSAAIGANYTWLDATYRSPEVVGAAGNSSNDQAQAGLPGVDGTIQINPGNRIPLIPRQILKLFADYDVNPMWTLGLDMTAVSGSFARGNENNQHQSDGLSYLGGGTSGGYSVFNLTVDYRPTPKLKLFALVSNLLDRRYNTAAQLGATAFDANGNVRTQPFPVNSAGDRPLQYSTFYAPGAPRAFVLGLRYTFGD